MCGPVLAGHSIGRAAGEHADQDREQNAHDGASGRELPSVMLGLWMFWCSVQPAIASAGVPGDAVRDRHSGRRTHPAAASRRRQSSGSAKTNRLLPALG